jgi:hypothetical protein
MMAGAPRMDPIERIAQELGLSSDQVRKGLANPACPDQIMLPKPDDPARLEKAAQALGVTSRRLSAAITAALPPLPPPDTTVFFAPDETTGRIAAKLGVSRDRLEAAMKEAARVRPGDRIQLLLH